MMCAGCFYREKWTGESGDYCGWCHNWDCEKYSGVKRCCYTLCSQVCGGVGELKCYGVLSFIANNAYDVLLLVLVVVSGRDMRYYESFCTSPSACIYWNLLWTLSTSLATRWVEPWLHLQLWTLRCTQCLVLMLTCAY